MPSGGDFAAATHAGANGAFRVRHLDAGIKDPAITFRLAGRTYYAHLATKSPRWI